MRGRQNLSYGMGAAPFCQPFPVLSCHHVLGLGNVIVYDPPVLRMELFVLQPFSISGHTVRQHLRILQGNLECGPASLALLPLASLGAVN
jgi:hypothetical protein